MKLRFPSPEFDDAVAAVCHGQASESQAEALREVLLGDPRARDEYLFRVSLHTHLASEPALFAGAARAAAEVMKAQSLIEVPPAAWAESQRPSSAPPASSTSAGWRRGWVLAAGWMALLGAAWWLGAAGIGKRGGETSRAVAMLNRVVNARWNNAERAPRLGAPLEPGTLRLDSGLAQIVFYNGARVVIEGPAEIRLVSSTEAVCVRGTLTAEVPPPAQGFRVVAPRLEVTDLGTAFGLKVGHGRSELHVFEGQVEFRTGQTSARQDLAQGRGAVVEGDAAPKWIAADPAGFAELFDLQAQSVAAEARRYDQWRESIRVLRRDPSLWVHFDFEHGGAPDWRLPNLGAKGSAMPDATIVGCEWREGRWATKPALEFHGISDRLRLHLPGELDSVTLAAWVRVEGLDRQIHSLFMSDGFAPGTLHWVLRHDGVLGLTVIGPALDHQILASPPVLTRDQLGLWTQVAVVLDGRSRQVVHYLNGRPISRHGLRVRPPFRLGAAELGNWNAHGFSGNDPFLIRNFSGAMDEFCLFARALSADEIGALYAEGRPQADAVAESRPEAPRPDSYPLARTSPQQP